MLNKKIANIVFYKVPGGTGDQKLATIFYQDGTVSTVDFEAGIDACEAICQERHIQTKDAFKEMINRDVVHVMDAADFRKNFNLFKPAIAAAEAQKAVEAATEEAKEEIKETVEEAKEEVKEATEEAKEAIEEKKETAAPVVAAAAATTAAASAASHEDGLYHFNEEEKKEEVAETTTTETKKEEEAKEDIFDGKHDFDSEAHDISGDSDDYEDDNEKQPGFFKRLWTKFKKNKLVKRITLCVLALAVAFGIYSVAKNKSPEGEMYRSNIATADSADNNNTYSDPDHTFVITGDDTIQATSTANIHYTNDAALQALFARTTNATQKTAMNNIGLAMDAFNNNFASYYLEEGVAVRPALKFDEVVALQVAYNDYSKDQLRAYFNGADVKAADMTRAYKDANLQLMGAYAIENAEHPVDMSMLLETQEGRDFYQRYHQAFLAAKTATGEEKIRLVTEFYKMVRADFPISTEVRTEGISHSQNYDSIEPYKLAVAPMIAAGEMMWQNLETDVTLDDMEIDFLNDLGLCNYADKSFERAELIALSSETDKTNPTFQEFKTAFVNYYIAHGTYYVDDEHRELTKLQSFQDAVNWHFDPEGEWTYQGQTWTETETHTEEIHWEDTTTTYHEETETHSVDESEVPEEIREDLQHQVDAEIEAENERRRREAEKDAEKERQRLQAEEDAHAAQVEQEVKQDEQDLQQHINDANEQINQNNSDTDTSNNTPVNESDLGHGVDFDDDHSDSNGNLDPSVQNITTDPTGDMTDQPLPDPNETGRDFDAQGEQNGAASHPDNTPISDAGSVESVPVDDDYYFEDAWIEYDDGTVEETGYQYHK